MNAESRNQNRNRPSEPLSIDLTHTELRIQPFPPYPTPLTSKVSTSSGACSKRVAYSTTEIKSTDKRMRLHAEKKWKSSGENNSSSSRSDKNIQIKEVEGCTPIRQNDIRIQRNPYQGLVEADPKRTPPFQRSKPNNYKNISGNKKRLSVNNQLRYKSTTQIVSNPPFPDIDIRKSSSAFELTISTASSNMKIPPKYNIKRTIHHFKEDKPQGQPQDTSNVDKKATSEKIEALFLDSKLIGDEGRKLDDENNSSYFSIGESVNDVSNPQTF